MITAFDLKNSLTRLLADYRYTLVVVLSMAMSLAISLFLYAQIYAINYKPLPVEKPDNIVNIGRSEYGVDMPAGLHYFDLNYFAERQRSLDHFSGGYLAASYIVSAQQFTERLTVSLMPSSLFRIAGVDALLGRTLQPADDVAGAEEKAVLGYATWERLFDKSEDVIGMRITMEGRPVTIVGVMPEGFKFPLNQDMWVSFVSPPDAKPDGDGWTSVLGRLKPGVTREQAEDEFKSLARELAELHPQLYKTKDINLAFLTDSQSRYMQMHTTILSVVAFAVLLMGCFSVANLLIVRILEHSKDSLIKVALGLPAWRVATGPLLESLWLCLGAGALGLWFCYLAIKRFSSYVVDSWWPYWWTLEMSPNLLLIGLLFIMLIWLGTGIAPVLLALRTPTNSILAGGRKGGAGTKSGPLMSLLVSLQVMCAFILMVFTGLSMAALYKVSKADYGVPVENFVTAEIRLPTAAYPKLKERADYLDKLKQMLYGVDTIEEVAFANALPGQFAVSFGYTTTDRDLRTEDGYPLAMYVSASNNMLDMLEVEVLEGRGLLPSDTADAQRIVVINKHMAEQLWPDVSAVGKQFQESPERNGAILTVVGVMPNIVHGAPIAFGEYGQNFMYLPIQQSLPDWANIMLLAKTRGDPYAAVDVLKETARKVDPQVALSSVMPYTDLLDQNGGVFRTWFYNFFPASLLALIMAALGIYGITARIVLQQTNDIGIMKALGATDARVNRNFLARSGKQLAAGLVPGMVLLIWLLPKISEFLVQTNRQGLLLVSAAVAVVIAALVFIASYLPLIGVHRITPHQAIHWKFEE